MSCRSAGRKFDRTCGTAGVNDDKEGQRRHILQGCPSRYGHVRLPAYTLLNAGFHYENDYWKVGIEGKNLTNERYFRSNFPDLFGSSVELPQLPRNFLFQLGHKF
jgi:outer membrane receptor protein involved in Fe transport